MDYILRLIFAFFISKFIANKAHNKNELTTSGKYLATIVGIIITASSFCHFGALITFFYVSNKATKYKRNVKKDLEENEKEKKGQRDIFQVLANGFTPLFYSALYIWETGCSELPIDFTKNRQANMFSIAILASLACACGDTLASELGTVFSESRFNQTYQLLKFKKVKKGTNGGVSLYGTLASIFGGLSVGLSYYLTLKLSYLFINNPSTLTNTAQWPLILVGAAAGFFGSLIDSFLGEVLQYSGFDKDKKCIVENPSTNVDYISGNHILNNNQVNFFSCLLTAWFIQYVTLKFYVVFNYV